MGNLLAKSEINGGTTLIDHSKAVTNFTAFLFDRIINSKAEFSDAYYTIKDLRDELIACAAMHDIGKCSKSFQEFIKSKRNANKTYDDGLEKNDKLITHNVIGWAYLDNYTDFGEEVKSAVLHHHVVLDYMTDLTAKQIIGKNKDSLNVMNEFFDEMAAYCKEAFSVDIKRTDKKKSNTIVNNVFIYNDFSGDDDDLLDDLDDNAKYILLRSIIIFADRAVSEHHSDTNRFIKYDEDFMGSLLDRMIVSCDSSSSLPDDNVNELKNESGEFVYNQERLKAQNDLLTDILKQNNSIVSASAGFGKTLVGLRWILANKKRTLWVVPRNVIANGTYQSLKSELETMQMENKVSIALLLHSEYIEGDENADIIVTNIDNFLSPMVKNSLSHKLIQEIGGNVIFDEYHEFMSDCPLYSAFIGLLYTRTMFTNTKTLLLSATPLRFDKAFGMNDNIAFLKAAPFNGDMKVNVKVQEMENVTDLKADWKDTFIFTNTVRQAQDIYSHLNKNSDNILMHARFPKQKRIDIENNVYDKHGKHSVVAKRNTVVSTNILGVGIDASAKSSYDFAVSPEDTIQRGCGRTGRFAEKEYDGEINYTLCVLVNNPSTKNFITRTYNSSLNEKWVEVVKAFDGKTITKNDLYDAYYKFYEDNKKDAIGMFRRFFNKSAEQLKEMHPYSSKKKKVKSSEDEEKLMDGLSYRGMNSSIYVVANYKDKEEICDSIILDRNFIGKSETKEPLSLKERFKKFRSFVRNTKDDKRIDAFKHMFKDYGNMGDDDAFRLALRKDTPLFLSYAEYDDTLGLRVNVNPPIDDEDSQSFDEDFELD